MSIVNFQTQEDVANDAAIIAKPEYSPIQYLINQLLQAAVVTAKYQDEAFLVQKKSNPFQSLSSSSFERTDRRENPTQQQVKWIEEFMKEMTPVALLDNLQDSERDRMEALRQRSSFVKQMEERRKEREQRRLTRKIRVQKIAKDVDTIAFVPASHVYLDQLPRPMSSISYEVNVQ